MVKKQLHSSAKEPRRIALVASKGISFWTSARTIRENLRAAYLELSAIEPGFEIKNFEVTYDSARVQQALNDLETFAPTDLIFLESYPVPSLFLKRLAASRLNRDNCRPILSFHLYGDFTIATPRWLKLEPELQKFCVRFYAASPAQQRLLKSFLSVKESVVVCPFPIDEKALTFLPTSRRSRGSLNLIYAGRLSRQKGVFLALEWLARVRAEERWGREIKIAFAGAFDDIGTPMWGGDQDFLGTSYATWQRLMRAYKLGSVVKYCGELNHEELKKTYRGADAFLSLSLHHDEDYGMAPLEALACGTPCLLTEWGGFGGFAHREGRDRDVWLCRTAITSGGLSVSYADFLSGLRQILARRENASRRRERSAFYHSRYGVRAVARRIHHFINEPAPRFKKFSSELKTHAAIFKNFKKFVAPFEESTRRDQNYFRTYRHYASSCEVGRE